MHGSFELEVSKPWEATTHWKMKSGLWYLLLPSPRRIIIIINSRSGYSCCKGDDATWASISGSGNTGVGSPEHSATFWELPKVQSW